MTPAMTELHRHKKEVIALRFEGATFPFIGAKFGMAGETVRKFINETMPPEQRKIASHRAMTLGRKKGLTKWRASRKIRKPKTGVPQIADCTFISSTCPCDNCRKFRQAYVPFDGERYRVIKACR